MWWEIGLGATSLYTQNFHYNSRGKFFVPDKSTYRFRVIHWTHPISRTSGNTQTFSKTKSIEDFRSNRNTQYVKEIQLKFNHQFTVNGLTSTSSSLICQHSTNHTKLHSIARNHMIIQKMIGVFNKWVVNWNYVCCLSTASRMRQLHTVLPISVQDHQ